MTDQQSPSTPTTPVSGDQARLPVAPPAAPGQHVLGSHPHPMVSVAPKNPGLALLASFFIPGLGSLMNGQAGKGVAIFAGYVVGWLFTFILIGIPFLIGFWIWGMVDAYTGAKRWNAQHGIIS